MGLRIASIFVILVTSTAGALFPILARRATWLKVPKSVFDFAKYFGSGVIIATVFIHLLGPALGALASECLSEGWHEYPWVLTICMLSIFALFICEIVAFRWGNAKLAAIGKAHDAHGHGQEITAHTAHGPETPAQPAQEKAMKQTESSLSDVETADSHHHEFKPDATTTAQIVGVAILEFGVVMHSVLIGLALAVAEDFKILFVVLVFHQTFEGLGIGSRLAFMSLPRKYGWVPYAGALLYGLTTPIGIAAGLGARSTYNAGSATSSAVNGILLAMSSGILLYTGLVELLAHDFLFSKEMMAASNRRLSFAIGSMLLGAALMSLLGKWA
ncbi:zinc-regulated transporter 2 [Coprinopsis sp. MPI-PUGE-AT-0042]|nr:zinc-regulated transporter 2 [Coprinopsis sp. MPI-PUGE-AT-0042]